MEYTEIITTEINLPNITVYKKLKDGVHYAWRVVANDGYVMYDTTANNTELDIETDTEYPVTYYYSVLHCPLTFDFEHITWVAIPRENADAKYIF